MRKRRRTTGWRSVFGPDEVIQRVRPRETSARLLNPHKGTTTFQRFNGDRLYPGNKWSDRVGPTRFKPFGGNRKNERYPDTTIAYCRWIWAEIEPEKGKYRWDIIDGALEAARVRGQTLQVRIQPYIREDVPAWYYDMGGIVGRTPGKSGRPEPDLNHPAYLKHWGGFIRAFGKRYDGHPDLESFDIAYGGPCGETGGNATRTTAAKLADAYLASFRKTQLVSMLGTHGCTHAAAQPGRHTGWRADCFGDVREEGRGVVPDRLCWNHMYDHYPKAIAECGVEDAWKTAPVTLETCWTVGHWHQQGWDIDWILAQGYQYHLSVFMPKSCYIPEEWAEKIEEFSKRMGYRFVLRHMVLPLEAKPGERVAIQGWVDNVGVAPIYRPYRFSLRFRQGRRASIVHLKSDPRSWLPGHTWFSERIRFPSDLRPGEVKVEAGLVGPLTKEARVRFAIEEVLEDGWHPLTSMDVLRPG